jgi:hypothetical protein
MKAPLRRDEAAEAASAMVESYLRARCEFETTAYSAFDLADRQGQDVQEAMADIRVAYDTLQRTYCTPDVVALKLRSHFGDPPSVNPDGMRVQGVRRRGDALVVTTLEEDWEPPAHPPDTVEYVVEVVDGRPLLADRRIRIGRGRWIPQVF